MANCLRRSKKVKSAAEIELEKLNSSGQSDTIAQSSPGGLFAARPQRLPAQYIAELDLLRV
jgi:hypothetical protein